MSNNKKAETVFPNPSFERKNWKTLDGEWSFAFDDSNKFEANTDAIAFTDKILVPFCYQSELSGVSRKDTCENVWYSRVFEVSKEELSGAVLLKFGAVDYTAKVYINNFYVGRHDGGFTPFSFEIGQYLHVGENRVTVKAEDSYSKEYPRGKQMWAEKPDMCWFTNTTGIWQSVWIEFTGENYITRVFVTPDIDTNSACFEIDTKSSGGHQIKVELSKNGEQLGELSVAPRDGKNNMSFRFAESCARAVFDLYWSPDYPVLIDVKVTLFENGVLKDTVYTYFGMRKIHVDGDNIFINNQPLYQRLVLDQGYWSESLMTPPSDEALKKDIEDIKLMGFNGARNHQKIGDPRYYYWADRLGLLIWGELPSAYEYTFDSRNSLLSEMCAFIGRDYNHPSIISWVPFNESWGVPQIPENIEQQNFVRSFYYLIKAYDPTRLVISNDGWEQIEATDICGIHDYDVRAENVDERYKDVYEVLKSSVNFKPVYARGYRYNGVPVILTETGGIKLKNDGGWGYNGAAENEEELFYALSGLIGSIRNTKNLKGYCYTQLTDVGQETNGLMTADRQPKIDFEKLRQIFGQ